MKRVVILSQDWRFRALLRAQLLEEGFEVRAGERAADLPGLTARGAPAPDLLVADLAGSTDPEADAAELVRQMRQIPLWIVTAAGQENASLIAAGLREAAERVFSRPLSLGELVKLIKNRLITGGKGPAGGPGQGTRES